MSKVRKFDHEAALFEARAGSPHVAIGRMGLSDGSVHEIVSVDRAFLIAALQDARSWCLEMEGTSQEDPGRLAGYDAALAVVRPAPENNAKGD